MTCFKTNIAATVVLAAMVASNPGYARVTGSPEGLAAVQQTPPTDTFGDERDRRYMELFKSLTDLVNQRFSDQAVAVAAAFAANEKAIQAAFASNEKATAAAFAAAKEAVQKAEIASDKRFESVNEFRAQLKDQAATFMARDEASGRLSKLEASQSLLFGGLAVVGSCIPIAAAIIVWNLKRMKEHGTS